MDTVDDLRNALFDKLVDAGTVGKVKAALRAQIVANIRSNATKDAAHEPHTLNSESSVSYTLDSLFADYLKCQRYMYTLSVFTPESQADQFGQLSRRQLAAKLFGATQLPEVDKESTSILSLLLKHSCSHVFDPSLCQRRHETWTQTDDNEVLENVGLNLNEQPSARLLQLKLSNVQKEYRVLTERSTHGRENIQDYPIEERMLRFQKECSERSKKEINREVGRFREREAMLIQQSERAKYQAELEKMKDAYFREHQAKLKLLREREGSLEEELALREKDLRDRLYQDRQNLLVQMNTLQDTESKRLSEQKLWEKEKLMEKERLKDQEREIAALRRKLDTERHEFAHKCEHEIKTYKLAVAREYQERQQAMSDAERRLKDRTADFERKKEKWDASLATWQGASDKYERESEACHKLTIEVDTLRADLEHMKMQNQFLKESLQNDRTRYDQLHENFVASAEKHARVGEVAEKELRALRLKNEDLRNSLDLVRENADANEHKLLAEIEQLRFERRCRNTPDEASALAQLHRANEHVQHLQEELEEKEHALIAAKKEVKELNALLFKARKAFTQISDTPPPAAPATTQANPEPSLYRAPHFAPQFFHPSFAYAMPQGYPVPAPHPVPPTTTQQTSKHESTPVAEQQVTEPEITKDNEPAAEETQAQSTAAGKAEEVNVSSEKQVPEEDVVVDVEKVCIEEKDSLSIISEEDGATANESCGSVSDSLVPSIPVAAVKSLNKPTGIAVEPKPKSMHETSEQLDDVDSLVDDKVTIEESVEIEESKQEFSIDADSVLSEKELDRRAAEALAQQRKSRDLERSIRNEEIREVEEQSRRAQEEANIESASKEQSTKGEVVKEEAVDEVDPLIAQYRASAQKKLEEQKAGTVEQIQTHSISTEASSVSEQGSEISVAKSSSEGSEEGWL